MKAVNLGIISGDKDSPVKFILIEDGTILFGKCVWHKDLKLASSYKQADVRVTGAGRIPPGLDQVSDETAWGGWKSAGYGIVTDPSIREGIRTALIPHAPEIRDLYTCS